MFTYMMNIVKIRLCQLAKGGATNIYFIIIVIGNIISGIIIPQIRKSINSFKFKFRIGIGSYS